MIHNLLVLFIVLENEKFKSQLSENHRLIAKFMKEKRAVKDISSIGIQFDYIVPSMGKRYIIIIIIIFVHVYR